MDVTHTAILHESGSVLEPTELTELTHAIELIERFDWSNQNADDSIQLMFSTDENETFNITRNDNGTYWTQIYLPNAVPQKKILGFIPNIFASSSKSVEKDTVTEENMRERLTDFFSMNQDELIEKYCN